MLTATLRADASSRFSPDNRWGYFPSVAAAWRVNEEAFLSNFKALSDLKLRLSYGQTGQQSIGSSSLEVISFSQISLASVRLSWWPPILRQMAKLHGACWLL